MNTLPFMLQLGRYLLDAATPSQRHAYQVGAPTASVT
jgi:hypothetical protein